MTEKLYSWVSRSPMSLDQAIQTTQAQQMGANALLYSPQSCHLAQVQDGNICGSHGQSLTLSHYFEARIFNETCELRWLNENQGNGFLVILADSDLDLNSETFNSRETTLNSHLSQTYLLWGKAIPQVNLKQGWQRLAEARIGKLDVPLSQSLKKNQRVSLHSREYLAEVDEFCNVAVIEERLVKLEVQ
ncbi:CRISPR-associated protein Csx19 [Phormidium yuhuli AB48]|uniref:CRISPR-associated protein Csx19 n=1 Tax=Phormidium yuhuli AB48 TaxID=2940671 RepID=A0ABY5AMT7_9CYAN|nr:CRISPR-associated protein Csx19 [Phormidium yuhuli]USR90510.1 CRISPR-associated protein Csx19 [Phormidium yuhuli AB48]